MTWQDIECVPDQIDMMSADELRVELRKVLASRQDIIDTLKFMRDEFIGNGYLSAAYERCKQIAEGDK